VRVSSPSSPFVPLPIAALAALAVACGGDDTTAAVPVPFALRFAATDDDAPVSCTTSLAGLGPDGVDSVGLSDLRFYISRLALLDDEGVPLETTLDADEFQYESGAGSVSLVDLTGNTEGTCADNAIAGAEGTARTHEAITGTVLGGPVARVTFDVGVPQDLMRETIANNTPEGAPSPLNEMYWNWASGYRHFVMNFTVSDPAGAGEGYLHVGSRNCGPDDGLALEDRAACEFINTPAVSLAVADLALDAVVVDVRRLLEGVDFVAPIYDTTTFDVIGEGPGVECHSSPMQPDCANVFANLGLDMASGEASADGNGVFSIARP
jgi:uncharacterized repeat protein (TIGR04052 family)